MSDLPQFVLIEDVAEHFKVSVSTARAWVRTGAIAPWAYIKIGNTYRFNMPKVVESLFPVIAATQQSEDKQEVITTDEKPLQQPAQDELDFDLDADQDQ